MPHVLIVDDDAPTRATLSQLAATEGFSTATAGTLREARAQMERLRPDAVLVARQLPDGNGLDLFAHLEPPRAMEVILIAGHEGAPTAAEALRRGVSDCLVRPISAARVKAALSRVTRPGELKAEIGSLRGELRRLGRFGGMLGASPAMQAVYEQIQRVAPTEATVFLIGESGTGKELAARTLHELSRRRKHPFLTLSCGAISPALMESELFGHAAGALPGTDAPREGCFERAHGGTLFLDEIAEMPAELQVKLLRALESGSFMRMGTHDEITADVRVIAATSRRPEEAVAERKLREDLQQRLSVFPLHLPPLRERGRDVALLARAFLDSLNAAAGTAKTFAPGALEALQALPWPGNVRELKNAVERAFILADAALEAPSAAAGAAGGRAAATPAVTVPVGVSLAEADRKLILATLEHCGGVKKWAAELLGVSLKTLYNRLEEYRARDAAHGAGPKDLRRDVIASP